VNATWPAARPVKINDCDNCGEEKVFHVTQADLKVPGRGHSGYDTIEALVCPDATERTKGYAQKAWVWRQGEWIRDGHHLNCVFEDGALRLIVECPGEEDCRAPLCRECPANCSHGYDDDDEECDRCEGHGWIPVEPYDCWVKHMAGEFGREFEEWSPYRKRRAFPFAIAWMSSGIGEDVEIEWRPV
jgi:hypothetical protein